MDISMDIHIHGKPDINLVGCWFHYTKAIYDKLKKLGLCKLYKLNKTFKKWIRQTMSLPFLPEEDIRSTYLAIHMTLVGLTPGELELVSSFKRYFVKTWLDGNENLSVLTTSSVRIMVLSRIIKV